MSQPFTIQRRVEFGDTDMAGIMHFSNFFRFMEVAETEYLRARGLSVSWFDAGTKYGFPRVSVACDYRKPARFEDLLTIAVTLEQLGRKSVTYRFEFTLGAEVIAIGTMTSVFCRSQPGDSMVSLDIPPEVRTRIEAPHGS